jgi:hypothetical protein
MPENGKNEQCDKQPGCSPVKFGCFFESENIKDAMHLEPGHCQKNY